VDPALVGLDLDRIDLDLISTSKRAGIAISA
jgi:hypothetical protein